MGDDTTRTVAATPKAFAATITVEPPAGRTPASAFDQAWSEQSRYALVAELASGGGGKIGVAVDRKLGRRVALKRPLDADGNERLEREALVLARLEHPAIVPIHDAGRDGDGAPFYAMKLVGGQTLASRIDAATTFEQRLGLLAAVTTVADAMAYAHAQHVIHRDLKPGNVLVGEFGEVAVIDWGLGKVIGEAEAAAAPGPLGEQLTAHGSLLGTPAYMAPEQAHDGADADERADVYALGAMLYHVLTGDVPYGRITTEATLAKLLTEAPPSISEREPRVPKDLAAIVDKAMMRERAARYRTAKELAEDLHRYQTGRLVAAHRYRLHQRAWRSLRRHQLGVALAVAAVAVAGAGVLFVRGGATVDETCKGIDAADRAAWTPAVRDQGQHAFGSATVAWQGVASALDTQVGKIATMRVEACRAARVTKHETLDQLTARMTCLDHRTNEVRALADVLAHADAGTVEHASQLASSLGRVEDCADVERLRDLAPLPADTTKRAQVLAVVGDLDKLAAQAAAGQSDAWRSAAPALAERANQTDYAPVIARADLRWALALEAQRRVDAAAGKLILASAAADRGHDDATRATALAELFAIEVVDRARPAQAADLEAQATAAAERSGQPAVIARVTAESARLAILRGKPDEAIALAQRSGDSHVVADAQVAAGKLDDAEHTVQAALAADRGRTGGDASPDVAADYGMLADIAWKKGSLDAAIEQEQHELAIDAALKAPDVTAWLLGRERLFLIQAAQGHYAEAFAGIDALGTEIDKMFAKKPGTTSAEQLANRTSKLSIDLDMHLGEISEAAGKHDAAITAYDDAFQRAEAGNTMLPEFPESRARIGKIQLATGKPKEALASLRAALDLEVGRSGIDAIATAKRRLDMAAAYEANGAFDNAASEAMQALLVFDRGDDKKAKGELRLRVADLLEKAGNKQGAATLREKAQAYLR